MALIYITGNAGVGKTTVCRELQKRGYEAHDIDKNGITAWYDKITSQKAKQPRGIQGRSKEWFEKNAFKMVPERIQEFSSSAKTKQMFLCGQSIHDHEIWHLFDKIIYLSVDEKTLKHRLATRKSTDFGKTSAELKHILAVHTSFEEKHKKHGAAILDATEPLGMIVDKIARIC
jgi:dephospho-CoA kinase